MIQAGTNVLQNSQWGNEAAKDEKNKMAREGKWTARKFKSWEKFKIVIEMSWEHGARAGTHSGLRRQGEKRGPDLESLRANEQWQGNQKRSTWI